jgi:hypothetical protein
VRHSCIESDSLRTQWTEKYLQRGLVLLPIETGKRKPAYKVVKMGRTNYIPPFYAPHRLD